MKNRILLLLLCLSAFIGLAQAQRNNKGFFIEGTASLDTRHYYHNFILSPAIGYQFNKSIAGGFKARFRIADDEGATYEMYSLFVRYNYLTVSDLQLFAEAQGTYYDTGLIGGRSDVEEVGLCFGATYAVHKNIKLVGQYLFLGWSNARKGKGWWNSKDFGVDVNAQRFQLGVQFIF